MKYELDLGEDAQADIDGILEWSMLHFGPAVRDGYEALISTALRTIADDPELPGSHDRRDIRPGIRSLHLMSCRDDVRPGARRIAKPRHFVVYRRVGSVVQVVRLLHDAMDVTLQHVP